MEKISRRLFGVLATKSSVPSGESARGRTCPLSKSVNEESVAVEWATPRATRGVTGLNPGDDWTLLGSTMPGDSIVLAGLRANGTASRRHPEAIALRAKRS